jgi:hypothetical protein
MKNLSFNNLHSDRKKLIDANKHKDHILLVGNRDILISAPHGVSQVRLGKYKHCEIGSLTTAVYLQNETKCHLIAKTKNNSDDANFDENSKYKTSIKKLIQEKDIKYLIDIHGLASNRDCDINLGTHIGQNIKNDLDLFNNLYNSLISNSFNVSIDQPFMAGQQTISGSINNEFNLWTLQVEINCAITNKKENFERYKKLLTILTNWIKTIKP